MPRAYLCLTQWREAGRHETAAGRALPAAGMPLRDLPEAIEGSGQLQPEDGRTAMARLRGVDGVVSAVLADGKRGGPGGGAGRSIDMDAVVVFRGEDQNGKA